MYIIITYIPTYIHTYKYIHILYIHIHSNNMIIYYKIYQYLCKSGQTIALLGPLGCGKCTVVSLIERFYDPLNVGILLDDVDIRELNIR